MQFEENLLKKFITYVTAAIASFAVFSLYSIVDGILVARGVSEFAMGAVNLASPYISGLFSASVLFAAGTSTIISIMMGEGNSRHANELFSKSTAVLLGFGLIVSLLAFLFPEAMAHFFGAEDEMFPYVVAYIRGLAPFSFSFMVSYNLEILVKADGYPHVALYTVTIGCLSNCVLDILMIFVLKWGVFGAAFATGISQFLTVVIYVAHFLGPKATFRFCRFRPDFRIFGRLFRLGLPDCAVELCNGIMIFMFNRMVLMYLGETGLVSYTIVSNLNTLVLNLAMGISQGAQPLLSFEYGANQPKRVRRLLRYEFAASTVLAITALVIFLGFAQGIAGLYLKNTTPEEINAAAHAIRIYCLGFAPVVFNIVIAGFLTAVEKPWRAMVVSYGRGIVVQAIVLVILSVLTKGQGIWFTALISEAICLAIGLVFMKGVLGKKDGLRLSLIHI